MEQWLLKPLSVYWFLVLNAVWSRRAAQWKSCMDPQWSCTASHYGPQNQMALLLIKSYRPLSKRRAAENPCMSPGVSCMKSAYGVIWAHRTNLDCCQKMVPMVMNGPSVFSKMPPISLHGPTAPPKMLQKHLYGPIIAAENSTGGSGWSCCLFRDAPGILYLYRPIVTRKKYHQ